MPSIHPIICFRSSTRAFTGIRQFSTRVVDNKIIRMRTFLPLHRDRSVFHNSETDAGPILSLMSQSSKMREPFNGRVNNRKPGFTDLPPTTKHQHQLSTFTEGSHIDMSTVNLVETGSLLDVIVQITTMQKVIFDNFATPESGARFLTSATHPSVSSEIIINPQTYDDTVNGIVDTDSIIGVTLQCAAVHKRWPGVWRS